MLRLRFLCVLTVNLFLFGCTPPINISSDYDTKINFSGLKNYRWHAPNKYNHSSTQYLADDITDYRIRSNIDDQMEYKGLLLKAEGPVDFLVNYSITVEDKSRVNNYNTYGGVGPGFNYGGVVGTGGSGVSIGYSSGSEPSVTYYQQGTLVIDILDPETDKLIWRGSADGRLPKEQDQEDREVMIKEAVSKILEKFPPKIKK